MSRHYIDPYLINPNHPITVLVIGCGGTGSYVVSQLAKVAVALKELQGTQMQVLVADDDKVEAHNVGRQLFSESDVGEYKANVMISRVNRFYGLEWRSHTARIDELPPFNIVISCVDNVSTRRMIQKTSIKSFNKKAQPYQKLLYWMDFGNSRDYGQYVLSTFENIKQPEIEGAVGQLKNIFQIFKGIREDESEPSCSMAESLSQQDLFINLQLATAGISLIWKLLKDHSIEYHGQFMNLATGQTRPLTL